MIVSADVYLWGSRIGQVLQLRQEEPPVFEYDNNFIRSGIQVAPFMMPLNRSVYSFPELMRIESFKGLPGLLADSLPDRFGNVIISEWLTAQGRKEKDFTAIERLCYTGTRGMGALEFQPSNTPETYNDEIDLNSMVELASKVLENRRSKIIDDKAGLRQLISVGTSAGGARPKILIAVDKKTGRITSGQIDAGKDTEYWLLKLDGVTRSGDHGVTDAQQYTRIEYVYYQMAVDAGIEMMECRLLQKDGRSHFMTRRFDRVNGDKVHVQTLSALRHYDYNIPGLCSYESYCKTAHDLGLLRQDMQQIFKRTVFSMLFCNYDDHVKNFSFLMDRQGKWHLSPAYDVTFAYAPENQWLGSHQMSINGKRTDVTTDDLLAFGSSIGLSKVFCKKVIAEQVGVAKRFPDYAAENRLSEQIADEIYRIIRDVNKDIFEKSES